ncbi:hypothetical protein SAMN05443579_103701 [Variovorax sp. PDC80]|uniref:hypothetical protein n=1 Tax=Variovorax sp. PDC80 TaxID=1882827 RepID=UPI0008E0C5C9|nr:hypothetical protein [Variovorax sp. PDC80]SFO54265.1 hypothetical protein SAMN05443579_103701 [Variovorax sp. PDC80]
MIDPSTQLAAMIRAQFAAQFRAQSQQQSAGRGGIAGQGAQRKPADASEKARRDPAGDSADGVDGFGAPADAAQLQQLVALRVRALSPNDPQRERKAFRLFLESVLVQAFGRDRLDDKGFDQMVDAVLQRMEGDAELHAALREAGALLLSESQPAGK